jgi:F-type H+-transporting ATPase subunit gamma
MQTKALKNKIGSVKNIRKITKAMEMVAASKMRSATVRAGEGRSYASAALALLVELSRERGLRHPLLTAGDGTKTLFIVIGGNKGLCGGFHVALHKALTTFLKEHSETKNKGVAQESAHFITIGKRAEHIARRLGGARVRASFSTFPDAVSAEDLHSVRRLLLEEYATSAYERVFLVYNHYVSAVSYTPLIRQLLPLDPDVVHNILQRAVTGGGRSTSGSDSESAGKESSEGMGKGERSRYLFEPSDEAVLEAILPRLIEAVLYQSVLESLASEHSARMFAVKNASDNATTLADDLTLAYNRARQGAITQEIAEIAAGASV